MLADKAKRRTSPRRKLKDFSVLIAARRHAGAIIASYFCYYRGVMAIDQRNQLLREAAGTFWPDLPASMQAAALAAELSGYASVNVD